MHVYLSLSSVSIPLYKEVFGWSDEQITANILDVYNDGQDTTNFLEYDEQSLMRYARTRLRRSDPAEIGRAHV